MNSIEYRNIIISQWNILNEISKRHQNFEKRILREFQ